MIMKAWIAHLYLKLPPLLLTTHSVSQSVTAYSFMLGMQCWCTLFTVEYMDTKMASHFLAIVLLVVCFYTVYV